MTESANRKRNLLLILILALCTALMAGCARETPTQTGDPIKPTLKFPNEPPLLSVSDGASTVYAWRGTCSWDVKKLDGAGTGVQMDSPHPLDRIEDIASLQMSKDAKITLTFEATPSDILVRKYKWGASDYDAYEEIEIKGNSFEAERGNYLYEVIAKWDNPLKPYSGTAYYAFRTNHD